MDGLRSRRKDWPALCLLCLLVLPCLAMGAESTPDLVISKPSTGDFLTNRTVNVTGTASGMDYYMNHTTVADFNGTVTGAVITNSSGGEVCLGPSKFDDFDDNSLDTSKWTASGSLSVSETNKELKISGTAASQYWSYNKVVKASSCGDTIQADIKLASASGTGYGAWIEFYQDSSNYFYWGYTYDSTGSASPTKYAWGKLSGGSGSWGMYSSADSGYNTFKLVYNSSESKVYLTVNDDLQGSKSMSLSNYTMALYVSTRANGDSVDARFDNICTNFEPEGNYTSPALDSIVTAPDLRGVSWNSSVPNGTELTVSLRFSAKSDMSSATPWTSVENGQTDFSYWAFYRYVQYRLDMATDSESTVPVLSSFSIRFFRDVVKVEASLDQSTWQAANGTTAWSIVMQLAEDSNKVYVRAVDVAGENTTRTVSVTVDTTPPAGSVIVESGMASCKSREVQLTLSASDKYSVKRMQISNDPGMGTTWEDYAAQKAWTLAPGDGQKTVYARFMDTNGLCSEPCNDTIILDTVPPEGGILIDQGAGHTHNATVGLELWASDTYGVAKMKLSNYEDASGMAWEDFCSTRRWTLRQGDGPRTVYVKYLDAAGGESAMYCATIFHDTTAPEGSLLINSGDAFTGDPAVLLSLDASDNWGVEQMRLSADNANWSRDWEPYQGSCRWALQPPDGGKQVFALLRDRSGLESAVFSDSIILDTEPPAGFLVIESNATVARSASVNLTFIVSDLSGVAAMQVANAPSFESSPWAPFATPVHWDLLPGDGDRTVYARFRDGLGHVSAAMTDSIALLAENTTPNATLPEARIAVNGGAPFALERNVTLSIEIVNGTAVQMRFSGSADLNSSLWQPFSATAGWRLEGPDGNTTVYAGFLTPDGRVFTTRAAILLDTQPPTGSVAINDDAPVCGGANVTLRVNASDQNGVTQMQVSNDLGFTNSSWEPYRAVRSWNLLAGHGRMTVYVRLKDAAGRTSAVFCDTIMLDFGAVVPTGRMVIDGGARYTRSGNVTLTISLDNTSDADSVRMMVSEDPAFFGCRWQPFSPILKRTLSPGDGTKTLFCIFELRGIGSPLGSATIILDRTAPVIVLTGPRMPSLTQANTTIEGWTEPGCELYINGWPVALDGRGAFSLPVDLAFGPNNFTFRARDPAGNQDQILLSLTRESPPVEKPVPTTTQNLLPLFLIIVLVAASLTAGMLWAARRSRGHGPSRDAAAPPAPGTGAEPAGAFRPAGTAPDAPAMPRAAAEAARLEPVHRVSAEELEGPDEPAEPDAPPEGR